MKAGCDPMEDGYSAKNVERMYRDRIRDLERQLAESRRWQPIETAPKENETWIIGEDDGGEVARVFWCHGAWIDRNGEEWNMLWWMPNPAPTEQE